MRDVHGHPGGGDGVRVRARVLPAVRESALGGGPGGGGQLRSVRGGPGAKGLLFGRCVASPRSVRLPSRVRIHPNSTLMGYKP